MLVRITNLVIKDLQEFVRDRILIAFILVGPTLMLVMTGYASGEEVTHLPVAILDEDQTSASRELATSLDNLEELDAAYELDDMEQARPLLERGEAAVAVAIPSGFAKTLGSAHDRPSVQVLVDGSNIVAAYTALRAAEGAISEFWRGAAGQPGAASGPGDPSASRLDLRITARFNEELNHHYFLLPAQLSVTVLIVTMTVASVGLVRERETGTLEQLMVTPLRRIEVIMGKAALPTLVAFVDYLAMLAMVVWVFGVPVRGSLPLLSGVTLLFIQAQLTWGLVISAFSATQQQAILSVFMICILNVGFSGYLVAVENMPLPMQWISNFFPIRHYLTMMRAIMLKRATLAQLQPQLMALTALGIGSLAVAWRSLRKRLD